MAFWYAPDCFERITGDVGALAANGRFRYARLPALRTFASLIARAGAGATGSIAVAWEELGVFLAARATVVDKGASGEARPPRNAVAHVSQAVRAIARHPDEPWTLTRLARDARLSPYHFLRTFQAVTGVTPHQFILRTRLREAAARVVEGDTSVLDIALDCGFGDVSNFNRAFREEFGVSPSVYRSTVRSK